MTNIFGTNSSSVTGVLGVPLGIPETLIHQHFILPTLQAIAIINYYARRRSNILLQEQTSF